MSAEPYYSVGPNDVFPEQFARFLVSDPRAREIFLEHHADLMDPAFWTGKQERCAPACTKTSSPIPRRSASSR